MPGAGYFAAQPQRGPDFAASLAGHNALASLYGSHLAAQGLQGAKF